MPRKLGIHIVPVRNWPSRDRVAWALALRSGSILDDGGKLARYPKRHKDRFTSAYGRWLAQAVRDPYLDLAPPVLLDWFDSNYAEWWNLPWETMISKALMRFVIREHELLGYDKGADNSSIILHFIGDRLTASGDYGQIGIGNPRLGNAIRVLQDLTLIEAVDGGFLRLTPDGRRWLHHELECETRA